MVALISNCTFVSCYGIKAFNKCHIWLIFLFFMAQPHQRKMPIVSTSTSGPSVSNNILVSSLLPVNLSWIRTIIGIREHKFSIMLVYDLVDHLIGLVTCTLSFAFVKILRVCVVGVCKMVCHNMYCTTKLRHPNLCILSFRVKYYVKLICIYYNHA